MTGPESPLDLSLLMAAMPTPLDDQEQLHLELVSPLIDDYVQRGVEGVYCAGSSGEGLLLSVAERRELLRATIDAAAGRLPVLAHVGAMSTRDSIALAQAAEEDGAVAVSMIPPIYYSFGMDDVVRHYQAVLDATSLSMILYNIPQFTGTEFNVRSAAALLEDPRVVGIKHTAHNLFALERMKNAFPGKTYINGFDETYLPALAAGADGTIGTTVGLQIELFQAIRSRFRQGDLLGAQELQTHINDLVAELVAIDVFPAAKYLSGKAMGADLGSCRRPFGALSPEDRIRLDTVWDHLQQVIDGVEGKPVDISRRRVTGSRPGAGTPTSSTE